MIDKQAYLIVAHNKFDILKRLCSLLDSDKNDIYIHADSRWKNFNEKEIKKVVKKSSVFFLKRQKIYWGGFSQIEITLKLLQKASRRGYSYYHFLSGVDLPIKNSKYIYNFFEKNKGIEFIQFESAKCNEKKYFDRYMYNYYFHFGRGNFFLKIIGNFLLLMQKILHLRRKRCFSKFYKGSNWFSITDGFAKYLLKNKSIIMKQFKHGLCCDEIFIQTLIMNSPFKKNLVNNAFENLPNSNLREIDWKRGNPYIWQMKDLQFLKNSKCLFARKFDSCIDKNIIDYIYDYNKNKSKT